MIEFTYRKVIMKSNGKDFSKLMVGHSLNSIAEYVAKIDTKKTEWL